MAAYYDNDVISPHFFSASGSLSAAD